MSALSAEVELLDEVELAPSTPDCCVTGRGRVAAGGRRPLGAARRVAAAATLAAERDPLDPALGVADLVVDPVEGLCPHSSSNPNRTGLCTVRRSRPPPLSSLP